MAAHGVEQLGKIHANLRSKKQTRILTSQEQANSAYLRQSSGSLLGAKYPQLIQDLIAALFRLPQGKVPDRDTRLEVSLLLGL
ncbi:hypothetical protein D3C76_1030020 [compost metagenome]